MCSHVEHCAQRALQATLAQTQFCFCIAAEALHPMAPHLTPIEQHKLIEWRQKLTPIQVHQKLPALRARRNIQCPDLTAVRKFLKGNTHRRGAVQTRGAKRKWTRAHVLTANRVRRQKIKLQFMRRSLSYPDRWRSGQISTGSDRFPSTCSLSVYHDARGNVVNVDCIRGEIAEGLQFGSVIHSSKLVLNQF